MGVAFDGEIVTIKELRTCWHPKIHRACNSGWR